jgi:dihydroflavonol-4-reductase
MVMPGEDRSPFIGLDVEFVEGNLLDASSLTKVVVGTEQLYHLAALFAVWTKDPDLHYKINVDGTRALMEAAQAAGVEKIVYTSSVAALGINADRTPATEKTAFNCWPWASEYLLSKFISHQMIKGMVSQGLPATMVLPALPFGAGDRAPTPTGSLIVKVLKGEMKNYWDGGLCPVDVRDVAQGHTLAMEKGRIGESYLLGNSSANMTHQEFLQLVGKLAGVPKVATRCLSHNTMLTASKVIEAWSKLSGRPAATTYKNTLFALQHCYVDASKAIEELGLPQTPVEDAILRSIEWFRANNYAQTP